MENISYKCSLCGRSFHNKENLTYHLKFGTHTKCLNCGKVLSNKKFCNSHCATTFNNKSRHLSQATKEKISKSLKSKNTVKYSCQKCGKKLRHLSKSGLCRECWLKSDNNKLKEFARKGGQKSVRA